MFRKTSYDWGRSWSTDSWYTFIARSGDSCESGKVYDELSGQCREPEVSSQKGGAPAGDNAPQSCAGNPINFAIGNKYQQEVDYQPGLPSPLRFARSYNSVDGIWRHTYSARLRTHQNRLRIELSDGREVEFLLENGIPKAQGLERGRLTREGEYWHYASADAQFYKFDSAGRLVSWIDAQGYAQNLVYPDDKVTVTDTFGHTLHFTQDAQLQPLSLTAGDLSITYGYNANQRLSQLTRSRAGHSETRQYHYEDPRDNKLLTGITDERGVRYATWAYDDQGRAISSEHAGAQDKVTIDYHTDGSATVTNPLGKRTTYRFQTIDGSKKITAIEGEPSANCPNSNATFAYNDRGLLERKTDNKGHVTTYSYNARGLEETRTEAYGTPLARTITTEWHPTLFLPLTVTEPGRVIRYQYDDQGRSLGQTIESP
jgi:YD repeat-containing protein